MFKTEYVLSTGEKYFREGNDAMYKKVDICGINTALLPKRSNAEIEMLLIRLKNGDLSVKDEFIRSNLRLVLSITQKFSSSNENIDDIFQIGCIGLIKALDNFDLKFNVKFSTYAVPMIIGEIKRYLRDSTSVKVSRSLKDIAYKTLKIKEEAAGKSISNEKIASILGVKEELINDAMQAITEPCSLYENLYQSDNEKTTVMDQVKDEKNNENSWIDNISLREAIKTLSKKEKEIIELRYYKGKTQVQVAAKIGISQAQVSRIEKNALSMLKNEINF